MWHHITRNRMVKRGSRLKIISMIDKAYLPRPIARIGH